MNTCLLAKWLVRFYDPTIQELRKTILNAKYSHTSNRLKYSPFWVGVSSILDIVQVSVDKIVGDGITTKFWHDRWLLQTTLASAYSSLYALVQEQNISIFSALHAGTLQITFTHTLNGIYLVE
jgi:hypothetical protein